MLLDVASICAGRITGKAMTKTVIKGRFKRYAVFKSRMTGANLLSFGWIIKLNFPKKARQYWHFGGLTPYLAGFTKCRFHFTKCNFRSVFYGTSFTVKSKETQAMKTPTLKQVLLGIIIASIPAICISARSKSEPLNDTPASSMPQQKPAAPSAPEKIASKVDFDAYEKLVAEVREHRKNRIVSLEDFKKLSKGPHTIILDTRSDAMYEAKHVKGAIHLNFSDFNQFSLSAILRSPDDTVLIYCNNNFANDEAYFVSKAARPTLLDPHELTLALNIPTYINLYGYGYKNVYELGELISVFDNRVEFEGTAVRSRH